MFAPLACCEKIILVRKQHRQENICVYRGKYVYLLCMLRENNSCSQTASTGKHSRASCPIHVDTMAARVAKRGRATFACKIHSLRYPFPGMAKAHVFPSKQPIVTPSKWGKPCCCLNEARSCAKCLEEVTYRSIPK